nr:PHP domain-containing protein [Waterburya agarophytonicola]
MIELHAHTTYSDGILTPQQLVERAASAGVKALAITDHDTLYGWNEAIAAAVPHNIEIIPGVELSTVYNGRSLHVLGY